MKTGLGFSITEIMITLMISALLMLGLTQIYLSVKYTYNLQRGLSQIEDDGRFVTYFLTRQIHLAGYAGCIKSGMSSNENMIEAYSPQQPPNWLDKSKLVKNSDILVIRTCTDVENHIEYMPIAYYVADYGQTNQAGQKILSLYEKLAGKNAIELVPGISSLKILYGISNRGNIVNYLSAPQLDEKNIQSVKTVEIHLLLNSISPVLRKPENYYFYDKKYVATDRLLYREWVITAALRQNTDKAS